jgi:lysophospholipase L1-like esterase
MAYGDFIDNILVEQQRRRNLTAMRNASALACLGDSRVAQIHVDTLFKNISNANIIGWAKALSGQRVTIATNQGNSGDRSDQMLARLINCLTSKAGTGYIHIGANDLAQAAATFVSTAGPMAGTTINTSNVAQHVIENVKFAYERMMQAGFKQVIVVMEPGATNLTAAAVAATHELNQRHREYAEENDGYILFDLPFYVWDVATHTTSAITFKANYLRAADPVHLAAAGAYAGGVGLASLFTQLFPPLPRELRSPGDVYSANGNINQLLNPMFLTATGGTNSANVTGSVPSGWRATFATQGGNGSGAQSCVVSNGTPADGSPGKETIMAITPSAIGDGFALTQDWNLNNWSQGDIIQAGAEVVLDDATNVAGAYVYLQANGTGISAKTTMDLLNISNTAFATGQVKMSLLTEKLQIPQFTTKSWVTMHVEFIAAVAAPFTVRIRRTMAKRRFS